MLVNALYGILCKLRFKQFRVMNLTNVLRVKNWICFQRIAREVCKSNCCINCNVSTVRCTTIFVFQLFSQRSFNFVPLNAKPQPPRNLFLTNSELLTILQPFRIQPL